MLPQISTVLMQVLTGLYLGCDGENITRTALLYQARLSPISYGYNNYSVLDKCVSIFIVRWQSLHQGKEMFRLTVTEIVIPSLQCI